MKHGFTLIELLIIVTLIAILSVAVIAVINPNEQINKARDVKVKNLLTDIFLAHVRYSQDSSKNYSDTPIVASPLNSSDSLLFLNTLILAQELKSTVSSDANLSRIFLTSDSVDNVTLCYLPKSKSSQTQKENHFDIQGGLKSDCLDLSCYYCLTSLIGQSALPVFVPLVSDPCSGFNPEYPNFPYTTNNSNKWSLYGCTNYSVSDKGCGIDAFCPPNQRHLVKGYYSVPFSSLCTNKWQETTENYCVSEPYANCSAHPLPSASLDFEYGCTNPIRPFSWK